MSSSPLTWRRELPTSHRQASASPADRNYIGGNRTGLDTGQTTTSETIQNNYFGIEPDGSGIVFNQFEDMDAAGTISSSGVLVKDNLIGGGPDK